MTSGVEDPIMDKAVYFETKYPEKNLDSDETLGSNEYDDGENASVHAGTKLVGNQNNGEENFDFTADIIDLLLCVENDENARQNIESIMDQWDEMNILGEDNSKATGNSETNAQTKTINCEAVKEEKSNTKSPDNRIELKPLVDSNIPVHNTTKTETVDDFKNGQASDRGQNTETVPETSVADVSSNTEKRSDSISLITVASKMSPTNQTSITVDIDPTVKTTVECLQNDSFKPVYVKPDPVFSYSSSSRAHESANKSENNDLNEKIRALVCTVCLKNYEQIMNSGSIPKVPCKPHPCPFCRGNYYQKSSADIHMKVHMQEETLKCRLCADTTDSVRKRNEKVDISDGSSRKRAKLEVFSCSVCSIKLNSRYELDKHLLFHRNASRKNFTNRTEPVCDKNTVERVAFEGTQAKTSAQKQANKFECNLCGKLCPDKSNYDFHCLSHNTKFTDIFDDIVSEKSSRPSTLDHSYGKSNTVAEDRKCGTDENENLKKVQWSETAENGSLKNGGANAGIVGNALMEVDDLVNFDAAKLNEGTAQSLNPPNCDANLTEQYNFSLSTYAECSAAKTEPVYVMSASDNVVFHQENTSIMTSSSSLLNNTLYQGKSEVTNELRSDVLRDSTSKNLNTEQPVDENVGLFEPAYTADTSCLIYENSNVSLSSASLTNFPHPAGTDLSSTSGDTHQPDEMMSGDIENIFQQYFYTHSDDKVHGELLNEEANYTVQNHIPVVPEVEKKPPTYNSTADTLSQFIKTNMNSGTEIKSNEIIQELFSNMNGNAICADVNYQSQTVPKSQGAISTVRTGLLVQKGGVNMNGIFTENLAIKVPAANAQLGTNILLNQNRENVQDLAVLQTNLSTATAPKNYLVVYVLPSSSSSPAPANANPALVTKPIQQKTAVASSSSTNETYIRLPTIDGKTTYLVPIMNRNESVSQPLSQSQVSSSTDDKVVVDVGRRNGGVPKAVVKAGQHPKLEEGKRNVKNAFNRFHKLNSTELKASKRVHNDYTNRCRIPIHKEERIDPGKLHITQPPPAKQIPNGKRNILQIAYDDACKLIEESVVRGPAENQVVVQASSITSTATATRKVVDAASSSKLSGNYTLLKQMLNSKPCHSSTPVEDVKPETPVEISFTNDQVTFQYSNKDKEKIEEDRAVAPGAPERSQECEVCHKTLSKADFLPHLKMHSKTLYKCTYCKEIFVQQTNLIQHMRSHLQPQVFNCELCNKSFTNVLLFRLHLLVHKGLLFICVSCIKLFNKKEDYENHLKTHDQNGLACTRCKRNFPNTVNGPGVIQNFTCIECVSAEKSGPAEVKVEASQTEYPADAATVKQMTDLEDLCFVCQYCDVICNGGVELRHHRSGHISGEMRCVVCNETFDTFVALAVHLTSHDLPRKFVCSHCSETFADRKSYQAHSHPNFNPYACAVCERAFCKQTELAGHSRSHIQPAACNCNYCGLQLESNDVETVVAHKCTHESESIVECRECDRKFVLQSEFSVHFVEAHQRKLDAGEQLDCDKGSSSNEKPLTQHAPIKQPENDFVCKHCKLTFGEFNELLSHWIKLHPENDLKCFKCSCCSRFFTTEAQWSHHANQSEKRPVLLPYSLQQFNDRSFKLEPDTKNVYSCHQCNKSFRNKTDIIKHVKSH